MPPRIPHLSRSDSFRPRVACHHAGTARYCGLTGVAIGQVLILDQEGYRITRCQVAPADLKCESDRLLQAIEAASVRLDAERENSSRTLGKHVGQIFSAHQQILLDPSLQNELLHLIKDEAYSAEYAVSTVFSRYAQAFRRMGSSIMAERALDIRDVERNLLEALGGHPTDDRLDKGETGVLACHDLTPGETARLDRDRILGFCTEIGGLVVTRPLWLAVWKSLRLLALVHSCIACAVAARLLSMAIAAKSSSIPMTRCAFSIKSVAKTVKAALPSWNPIATCLR